MTSCPRLGPVVGPGDGVAGDDRERAGREDEVARLVAVEDRHRGGAGCADRGRGVVDGHGGRRRLVRLGGIGGGGAGSGGSVLGGGASGGCGWGRRLRGLLRDHDRVAGVGRRRRSLGADQRRGDRQADHQHADADQERARPRLGAPPLRALSTPAGVDEACGGTTRRSIRLRA